MTDLKKIRMERGLSQRDAARRIGVSLRSYITYENDGEKVGTPKYRFFLSEVQKMNVLDEEHGILTLEEIRSICAEVFPEYSVDFCILFGSYAKGRATDASDVDLLIATDTSGLRFYELTERLREKLHKRVDLLDMKQLLGNEALLKEVLKEGIRVYRASILTCPGLR